MHAVEKFCVRLRHSPALKGADWLWSGIRPIYDRLVNAVGRAGLERKMNGTDPVRVLPRFRNLSETYEPEIWPQVMACVKPGDTVADVGAFIGLYTIAFAKRVGRQGSVIAFEPSPQNCALLEKHIQLNAVTAWTKAVQAAVGASAGTIRLEEKSIQSSVIESSTGTGLPVNCVTLDEHFAGCRLDLLKVDVEGFEQRVLEGAAQLLSDKSRAPHHIFVEVHPYAWPAAGASSGAILGLLRQFGYGIRWPDGSVVDTISDYGEIIASRV